MTDQESTPDAGEKPAEAEKAEDKAQDAPKTFDADYVKQLRSEAARYRTEAQEAKARAQEFEDRDKSELEKLTGKLSKAQAEKAEAEARLVRFEVAKDKAVPAEAVDFLQGNTREELEASADRLLELVKSRTDTDNKPDFDGGAREPAPDPKTPEQEHSDLLLSLVGRKPN